MINVAKQVSVLKLFNTKRNILSYFHHVCICVPLLHSSVLDCCIIEQHTLFQVLKQLKVKIIREMAL